MVENKIQTLIVEYVSRQKLVYECMMELRPDLIVIPDKTMSRDKKVEIIKKQQNIPRIPYIGTWQRYGTWGYHIHGCGCLLVNIITREPVEWDAPDINSFDELWFFNWYKWVIRINEQYGDISEESLKKEFENLKKTGQIIEVKPSKYQLVSELKDSK
jgi:hypothetical protein